MMGNSNSTADESTRGSEMRDAEELKTGVSDTEPLCDVTELQTECLQLKRGVRILALAIDKIFYDNDDSEESARDMETRLLALTSRNQVIVQKLIKNLEGHARLVQQGSDKNEVIMAMVRDLVTTINGYMATLIRNIRKLKRLASETKAVKVPKATASATGNDQPVYDVIGDHQDVDAMLIQLMETAAHREELEKDIVSLLVFWKFSLKSQ